MIDLGVAVGAVVALGGVGLGSWLTSRLQRDLLKQTHRREDRQTREDAYVAVLIAYRTYRAFVTSEAVSVRLGGPSPSGPVPLIQGGRDYAAAVNDAIARLHVLEGDDTAMVRAASQLTRDFNNVARARVTCGPGEVPEDVMVKMRAAGLEYARIAHRELKRFDRLPN